MNESIPQIYVVEMKENKDGSCNATFEANDLFVEMYKKDWKDLDAIVVPQSFIDSKKKVKIKVGVVPGQRRQKLKGESFWETFWKQGPNTISI
jgi:hypothetical protein